MFYKFPGQVVVEPGRRWIMPAKSFSKLPAEVFKSNDTIETVISSPMCDFPDDSVTGTPSLKKVKLKTAMAVFLDLLF